MPKSSRRRLRSFTFSSLRSRLLALTVPPAVLGILIAFTLVERAAWRAFELELEAELRQAAELGSAVLAQPVWYFDDDEILDRLRVLLRNDDIVALVIRDPQSGEVRAWCDEAVTPSCGIDEPWPAGTKAAVHPPVETDLVFQEVRAARLEIYSNRQRLRDEISRRLSIDAMLLGLVLLTLIVVVTFATRRSIARPLGQLREALGAAREGGLQPIAWESTDEIGSLVADFNAVAESEANHRSRLEEKLALLEEAFESLDRGFCVFNRDFKLVAFNRSYVALLGHEHGTVEEGMSLSRLLRANAARGEYGGASVDALIIDRLAIAASGEAYRRERQRPDGTVLEIDSQPLASGGFVSLYTDISRRKALEAQQRLVTLVDTLTRLPNRALFYDRLQQSLALSDRTGKRLALHLIDVDRLREVNEEHGTEVGDQVLRLIAERLGKMVRHSDTLARLDDDEFGVIQQCLEPVDDAALLAHRVLGSLARPFDVGDTSLLLSASVGITIYPDDDPDSSKILHHAELALHAAKAEGRHRHRYFVPAVDHAVAERGQLEEELFRALQDEQLVLRFQPRLDLGTGALMGVEALVWWEHPERGMLASETFFTLAKERGLIDPLTDWMLREACRQRLQWQNRRAGPWRVEVQIEACCFEDGDVGRSVALALEATTLPPELLAVEMSESALLEYPEDAAAALGALRERGVAVSARGFGVGSSSSFSFLERFPLDALKIEGRFVQAPAGDLGG